MLVPLFYGINFSIYDMVSDIFLLLMNTSFILGDIWKGTYMVTHLLVINQYKLW